MTRINFSGGLFSPAVARASLREREPIGREKMGRERLTVEGRLMTSHQWRQRDGMIPQQESSVSVSRSPASAAVAAEALRARIESRYASGDAVPTQSRGASWQYQFPSLPADTAEREARFSEGEIVERRVAFVHGYEQRPLLHGWRPFHDPFSSKIDAPGPELDEEPALLNPNVGSGPFYGRYVGPVSRTAVETRPPLTPVDKAAYIHDKEYVEIYDRYQYSEFEYGLSFAKEFDNLFGTHLSRTGAVYGFGWIGSHTSLDPGMQLELAWADVKLIGGSWAFLGEGLAKGFYSGGRGQRALITDLAWASAVSVFYGSIVFWRLAMAGVGIVYQAGLGIASVFKGLGKTIGGDVGKAIGWIGDLIGGVFNAAAHVFTFVSTAAFALYAIGAGVVGGVVGGVVYLGGKVVEAIGNVFDSIGDAVGCFITEAVTRSVGGDGDTLQILRRFRDEYMSSLPEGRQLILMYQELAPKIVRAIERSNERPWMEIRSRWINPAVELIKRGRNREALFLYAEMVQDLAHVFEIDLTYDGSRFHWKRDPRLRLACNNIAKCAKMRFSDH